MNKLIYSIIIAAALWFVMFSPLTAPHVNFWMTMAVSSVILTGLVTVFDRGWWRRLKPEFPDLFAGICIAAVLWGVFWVGDKVSSWLFDFARGQVDAIYGIKDGASPWLLSVLLLLLIGPAEEIFWRGYVQRTLSLRLGANAGFVVATALYASVHVPSCNFMLVMASLVAGSVWGILYRLYPERFPAIAVSHALWDAAVFVWFPI